MASIFGFAGWTQLSRGAGKRPRTTNMGMNLTALQEMQIWPLGDSLLSPALENLSHKKGHFWKVLFIFSLAFCEKPPLIQLKKENTSAFEAPLTRGGPGAMKQPLTAPRAQRPQGTHQTHLLGCVGLIHTVTQLEFMGLASMQGRETWNQVDQLPGRRRWGPRGLQLVLPPHGWCTRWGHGGDNIGGARRGADGMPLPGRWGQGTVA